MSEINDRAGGVGPDGRPPRETVRQRLARLVAELQDHLWSADEKWAADHGYDSWRSRSGWTDYARDPRFNLRQECIECSGVGRHPITGVECEACGGTGVVTLSDEGGEPR